MSDDGPDRRKVLATVGAAGVAALAGCTGEPPSDTDGNEASLSPPTRPVQNVDSEAWQYVLDSLEYQNAILNQLASEGE